MNLNMNNLPNMNELGDMAKKIFGDLRKSLEEVYEGYKTKHVKEKHAASSCAKTTVKKTTATKKTAASKTSKISKKL